MNPILIVIPILMILMFDLGLGLKLSAFRELIKNPRSVLLGLTGQIVLLPMLAFALGHLFHLDPLLFLGLMLIACSPGGSSSNVFSMLAGGNVALSVLLTTLSSVITLFTLPFIMDASIAYLNTGQDVSVTLPVGRLMAQNFVVILLPLLLGAMVSWRFPNAGKGIQAVLNRCAFSLLMVLISIFFIQHWATIWDNLFVLGPCSLLLILCSILIGLVLASLFKIKGADKRSIVIEIGMQNAAQAIAVASSPFIFNNSIVAIPAIVYALLMNIVLLSYLRIVRRGDYSPSKLSTGC